MKKTTLPLAMRRNCNLDLCLLPPASLSSTDSDGGDSMTEESTGKPRQLTIFYGGQISVCDVTELQARAIICLASREMEERMKTPKTHHWEPVSPSLQSQLHSPPGISMKRSLQQFLQKRKNRIQASSPYKR